MKCRSKQLKVLLSSGIFTALMSSNAMALENNWIAAGLTGSWQTPTNWTGNTLPTDIAGFAGDFAPYIILNDNITLNTFSFHEDATSYIINANKNNIILNGEGIINNSSQEQHLTNFNGPVDFYNPIGLSFKNKAIAGGGIHGDKVFIDNIKGYVAFRDHSSAGQANILNQGINPSDFIIRNEDRAMLVFTDHANADHANITNSGQTAFVLFDQNATASNAHIVAENNAITQFSGKSSVGDALIINRDAVLYFTNDANAAFASIQLDNPAGLLDISGQYTSLVVGSLEGVGKILLGSKELQVGNLNINSVINGPITDGGVIGGSGGSPTKIGTGTLTLNGISTYTGLTQVKKGALVIGDAAHTNAQISSDTIVGTEGVLGGHGIIDANVINYGVVSPGNSIGTLTITGDYTQASGSFLNIEFSNTKNSLLHVDGFAQLNGNGTVLITKPTFQLNHSYTILVANDGIIGGFAHVDAPNFFQGSLSYSPNSVQITFNYDKPAIENAVETSNQNAVANYIVGNSIDSFAVKNAIAASANNAALREFFDEFSAATYANQHRELAQLSTWFDNQISERIDGFPYCLNSKEKNIQQSCTYRGLWANARGAKQSLLSSDISGLDTNAFSLVLGGELPLSETSILGAALAYNNFDSTATARENATVDGNLYQFGFYGRQEINNWRFGAALAYGTTNNLDAERSIRNHSINANYDANIWSAQARASYGLETFTMADVRPFLGINYQNVHRNGFDENGQSGFELAVAASNFQSTRSQLGIEAQSFIGAIVRPYASIAWEHEFSDTRGQFNAALLDASGNFSIIGTEIGRDALSVKGGLILSQQTNWDVSVQYEGVFASNLRDNGAALRFNYRF